MGKFGLNIHEATQVVNFADLHPIYLSAISVAAVFFGAMTYIGNGPNFMVKSISERAGINMPSFFGYMIKYSVPILIPIFIVVWIIFYYKQG
jgi:Na+/H+ antiporter NhaD/arsenite permease-like protein